MARTSLRLQPLPWQPVLSRRRRLLVLSLSSTLPLHLAGCGVIGRSTLSSAAPQDYAGTMRQALKSFAGELPNYHFRATPVGNFGVGSIYLDDVSDPNLTRIESSWFLGGPDSWLVPSLPLAERRRWQARLIAEGSLGAFNVSASASRALSAQAGVAILSALVGNASLDYRKGVETSFQASEVRDRRLNWAEFEAARQAGRITPIVAQVVAQGKFVVAAADVVLMGYRAEVLVDEGSNPALLASLRTNVLTPNLRKASAGFKVSEEARGHFVVTATQPVVAAILFKRPPPQSKALGDGDARPNLDAWPSASVNPHTIDAVESRVLGNGSR